MVDPNAAPTTAITAPQSSVPENMPFGKWLAIWDESEKLQDKAAQQILREDLAREAAKAGWMVFMQEATAPSYDDSYNASESMKKLLTAKSIRENEILKTTKAESKRTWGNRIATVFILLILSTAELFLSNFVMGKSGVDQFAAYERCLKEVSKAGAAGKDSSKNGNETIAAPQDGKNDSWKLREKECRNPDANDAGPSSGPTDAVRPHINTVFLTTGAVLSSITNLTFVIAAILMIALLVQWATGLSLVDALGFVERNHAKAAESKPDKEGGKGESTVGGGMISAGKAVAIMTIAASGLTAFSTPSIRSKPLPANRRSYACKSHDLPDPQ